MFIVTMFALGFAMRKLYHHWLCPFSRTIRLVMSEKKLDFSLVYEPVWEMRQEFLKLNPDGMLPVLIDLNGSVIAGIYAITEYLEEAYPERRLFPESLKEKAEIRRLLSWFHQKCGEEVTLPLVMEKAIRRHIPGSTGPNSNILRHAKQSIHHHLDYISWLIERRKWLAGDDFSIVDLAASAHLSCVDYLGDVPWEKHDVAKDWYATLKSRPCFRSLLADRLPGQPPTSHYTDLDF
jgi:glutathione S-transferase